MTIKGTDVGELCAYSWCDGACGYPALVLNHEGQEYKAYGSMTAHGPVFQRFRLEWKGKKVEVPQGLATPGELLKHVWM